MTDPIPFERINSTAELKSFCQRAASSSYIGFDTEFVSESRYRPKLCLLQVATENEFAIIDTLEVSELGEFWELLVGGDHLTIAHAAREEFLFCYRACQQKPKHLFDIQLAAGMIGHEFPAAYSNLVSKILGHNLDKGETRTDWMKRPLTARQIDYALQDVVHLKPLYDVLHGQLAASNRLRWFEEETATWEASLELYEREPQWERVSGISGLDQRELAIVRELWLARDEEAQYRNRPAKRILPDDLLVELAKRGSAEPKRLKAIRGFESRVNTALIEPLCEAIQKALDLPSESLPPKMRRSKTMNLGLLGQLLTTALTIVCKQENIAAGIVGTTQDVRDLAWWHIKGNSTEPTPALARGWRAEIVGKLIEDLIDGSVAIRVKNPKSDHPLVLERMPPREKRK